ncbi:hypothetical protein HS7_13050 [Sulfolobales archaeon HS-7]|nr:hypothetical protein HS7_13050 [Sulfolobales archaeon HS-7]
MKSKAVSNSIAMIFLMIMIIIVAVPAIYLVTQLQSSGNVYQAVVSNYQTVKSLQLKAVETGHPAIYYASGGKVYFVYSNGTFSPPINLTITDVLYYNSGRWVSMSLNYPIKVKQDCTLSLPVNAPAILIETEQGNLFYIAQNSSIGPYSTVTKGGVQIISQLQLSNGQTCGTEANITTDILYDTYKNYTTPAGFPNQTGSFGLRTQKYIYILQGQSVITGEFSYWKIIGTATVNSTTSCGIEVHLEGYPVILIAVYTQVTVKVPLTITANVNEQITVSINGQDVTFTNSKTIDVTAGYVRFQVVTMKFNNYSSGADIYSCWEFSEGSDPSGTFSTPNVIFFISPTSSNNNVNLQYQIFETYYKIKFVQCNQTPNTVYFILNGTSYKYGQTAWVPGGNYNFVETGIVCSRYNICGWEAYETTYNGKVVPMSSMGSGIIDIDQPGTIAVYYANDVTYHQL